MSRKSRRKVRAASVAPKKFQIRGEAGAAKIAAAESGEGAPKLRRFSMLAYTGAPMNLDGFNLPLIVDLQGVRKPAQHNPILRQHNTNKIVGHSDQVAITATQIGVEGVVSGSGADAQEVIQLADNGFPWQASIGADPVKIERLKDGQKAVVNGRPIVGPMLISRDTVLGEISFVTNGADGDTSASIAASKPLKGDSDMNFAQYCASLGFDEATMEPAIKAAMQKAWQKHQADDGSTVDPATDIAASAKQTIQAANDAVKTANEAIAAMKAEAAEEGRKSAIRAAAKKHNVTDITVDGKTVDFVTHAEQKGWSGDKIELEAIRAARPGAGVGGPLVYSTSSPEVTEAVLECAVLQAGNSALFDSDFCDGEYGERKGMSARDKRHIKAEMSRYPEAVQDAAHKLFRGRVGLKQMVSICARAGGWRGADNFNADELGVVAEAAMRIRADGSSTMHVANVTANVQNKSMLQGYFYTEQTYREISPSRAVKDFKATKAINIFGDTIFLPLGENGELAHATVKDQAFANQVRTKGRMLTIPQETLVNDDVGAFMQIPMMMGRGAGLAENLAFWTLWLTPGYDEGGVTDFWATTHTVVGQSGAANYMSGGSTALSSTSLTAAVLLFDKMVDPAGNPLGEDAQILLYGSDLDTTARELMTSQLALYGGTTKTPNSNIWQGRFRPLKSKYINRTTITNYSTTAWWLLANPNVLPVIERAYLNGQEYPTVQTAGQDYQFNTLGMTMRAYFAPGVNMQNYRGGVKSAGA